MTGSSAIDRARSSSATVDALLERVAAGDQDAFDSLYRATSGTLFAICLRILPDRADAEDVLQDAYIAAWNKAPQFDPRRASAMTWLGAIARNRAIDRLRANPIADARVPTGSAEELFDSAASPAMQAEAALQYARLEECIGQLDERRRSLVRTAFFEASTYAQLARRLDAPLGSVKSWIRRSLLQLRACLES